MSARDRAGRARDDMVVARLHALAPHLDGEPDPAWQATTRARLVAMAAVRSPAPAPVSPLRRVLADGLSVPWRNRLSAGLAAAALGITALATLAATADGARPGDVLYALKRGTEQTQLALAGDARGEVLLDLASTRLDEVRALVEAGATALPAAGGPGPGGTVLAAGDDAALVAATLATMDAQTAEGAAELTGRAVEDADAGPLELLADWAGTQSDGLAQLWDDVPQAAEDDVADSLGLLSDLSARVSGLASSLDCADGPAVLAEDELGPVPAPCLPGGNDAGTPGSGAGDGSAPPSGVPDAGSAPSPGSSGGPSSGGSAPSVGGVVPEVAGGPGDAGVPPPAVPPPPSRAVPTSPSPDLPPLPTPLPGTSGAGPSSGSTPPLGVDVCLPPVVLADC